MVLPLLAGVAALAGGSQLGSIFLRDFAESRDIRRAGRRASDMLADLDAATGGAPATGDQVMRMALQHGLATPEQLAATLPDPRQDNALAPQWFNAHTQRMNVGLAHQRGLRGQDLQYAATLRGQDLTHSRGLLDLAQRGAPAQLEPAYSTSADAVWNAAANLGLVDPNDTEGHRRVSGMIAQGMSLQDILGGLGGGGAQGPGGAVPAGSTIRMVNQGATRDDPLSPDLTGAFDAALGPLGLTFEVFSGGQGPAGSGDARTGSTRHDHGHAADGYFYQGDRRLDPDVPADRQLIAQALSRLAGAGITGVGHGPNYMGQGSFHIGFGAPAVWGAGGSSANAQGWVQAALANPVAPGAAEAGGAGIDPRQFIAAVQQAEGTLARDAEVQAASAGAQLAGIDAARPAVRTAELATSLLGNVAELGRPDVTERVGSGSAEARAQRQAIYRDATELFFDWKETVYGEAEPPPAVLEQLQEAFGSPESFWSRPEVSIRGIALMQAEAQRKAEYEETRALVEAGFAPVSRLRELNGGELSAAERRRILSGGLDIPGLEFIGSDPAAAAAEAPDAPAGTAPDVSRRDGRQ